MRNNKLIDFKKAKIIKEINKEEVQEELNLKSVELYEPVKFDDLLKVNKKKYRNLKIINLKNMMENSLWALEKSIELYRELINKTEFWEEKSTYNFNFKDWNTLKKANGKLTRYYNDIKGIYTKIERRKDEN